MKIAVIGCGVVGGAVADGLERLGHEIFRHDPAKFGTTVSEVIQFAPEVAFICVPTPQREDGSCNTNIVESVISELLAGKYIGTIAVKSTVEPGFTQRMYDKHVKNVVTHRVPRLAFVPEFLREKSAFYDFTEGHDTLVVGTNEGANVRVFDKIVKAHGRYPKEIVHLTLTEAELVKYFSNVFNAARITFANGFYDICQKLGADYTAVKNAVATRGTFTDMYLDCNEKFRGFAGPCLPKDTSGLAHLADVLGIDARIFRTIVEDNKLYEPKVPEGMREN
jgi:UDPglucose 6-dehydrogenase